MSHDSYFDGDGAALETEPDDDFFEPDPDQLHDEMKEDLP